MNYTVVDTFTQEKSQGSPVTVVLDGSQLSDEQMRKIAAWAGLPTTTFVLPITNPKADYRLRIIACQGTELPFAGHSSLGTAFALIEAGKLKKQEYGELVQEGGTGLITIKYTASNDFLFSIDDISGQNISIPIEKVQQCFPGADIVDDFHLINAGPHWLVVQAGNTKAELLDIQPSLEHIYALSTEIGATGICIYAGDETNIEVRSFAQGFGEEFVCGSGNAAVAFVRQPKLQTNNINGYTATQGTAKNRPGTIAVSYSGGKVWIGGPCVTERTGKVPTL